MSQTGCKPSRSLGRGRHWIALALAAGLMLSAPARAAPPDDREPPTAEPSAEGDDKQDRPQQSATDQPSQEGETEADGPEQEPADDGLDADSSLDPAPPGGAASPSDRPDIEDETADGEGAEELFLFEDLPQVVSAARQSQPITMSSVPVSVITDEEIHQSGLTNIPDLLRFVPGMDVVQVDRNRFAVGVRGLHSFFSDRTLVLIDGRNATSPVSGATNFLRLPIFLEDIDRIEVVRGPGGAAWGANAFNGVINIITKEPEQAQGVFASARVNEFGDVDTHVRWGASTGDWSWRISAGHRDRETSEDAIDGDDFVSNDFSRDWVFDGEAKYDFSERSKLTFGLAYSTREVGDFEFLGFFPQRDGQLEATRAFARLDHEFESGATGYLRWFGNAARTNQPSVQSTESLENDLEGQLNFTLGEDHDVSMGGNARWAHIESEQNLPQQSVFDDEPFDEYWAGVFAIDRWSATDRLTIEGQIRGDWYSETGADWSGRLSGLYALDKEQKHVIRLSAAKAFRAPLSSFRETRSEGAPLPPPAPEGAPSFIFAEAGDLDNEQLFSLEAGYTARLAQGLTWRNDFYYQRFNDLIGTQMVGQMGPSPVFELANIDGAEGVGAETELVYKRDSLRLSAWYAFNEFNPDQDMQGVRSFLPAEHKVGAAARLDLPADFTVNANYRFTNTTPGNPIAGADVESTQRLDLTLAKRFGDGAGEVMVGVTDLFDSTEVEAFDLGNLTAHETPGRIFFVRLQLNF